MAKEKEEKKVRPAAALPCWFEESKRIAELHRREKKVDVSPAMLAHLLKIADLRFEVGDMLDRAGVPVRDMLFPAYGLSRAEQKRRAFEVIRRRADRAEATAARRVARLLQSAARGDAARGDGANGAPRKDTPGSNAQRRQRSAPSVNANGASLLASSNVAGVNGGNGVNAEGFALLMESGVLVKVESARLRDLVREITVAVKAELREELLAYIDAQGREKKLVDALARLG